MAEKFSEVKAGALFYNVDLHIHSPGSLDYEDNSVTAKQIVEKAIEKNLDLIAITDHNSISFAYDVIEAAKNQKITVLPGVEISCQGGSRNIHILAIFDCETSKDKILDLLSRIGISSEKRGKQEALTDKTISDVLDEIENNGGIAIAAHSDGQSGLTSDIRGQQRIRLVKNEKLHALEIVNKDTAKYFDGTDGTYQRKLPCIQSSDAHSLSEIGRRFTLLKMDKPCLEGVRQAFLDQESRIKIETPKLFPYPYIKGIIIEGGFLKGQKIRFNKNLNCLIGGRGAGKSTIIELIRFCLNALSKSEIIRERRLDMVKNALEQGTVKVLVKTKEGTEYFITRKIGEDPQVYNSNSEKIDLKPNAIFPIVCYGETEIEQISYDNFSQLDLVDKFSKGINELKAQEEETLKFLQKNTQELVTNTDKMLEKENALKELPEINEMLNVLKKYKFDTKLEKQKKRGEEKSFLAKIENSCLEVFENIKSSTIVDDLTQVLDELPDEETLASMPNKTTLAKAIKRFRKLHSHFTTNLQKEDSFVSDIVKQIEEISVELKEKHEKQEKTTLSLFEKIKAEGEGEAATKYLELQKKKTELELVVSDGKKTDRKIKKLEEKREKLLEELEEKRQSIFDKRTECAIFLSKLLGPKITISIEKGNNRKQYFNKLKSVLKGSRVHSKDIINIVKTFPPIEFVEIVKEKNIDEIVKKTDVTEHWAEAIVHFEQLREKLLEIQQVPLPDLPKILLEVGGKNKTLSNTSLGQKCTTLLSLIMLESELPLIVDTPEEGLDNIFVYDSVVKNLRGIKEKRQLILATHNANIPVLGDSELIFYLESDGKHGAVSVRGSIDEEEMKDRVQQVLEGGKEAFVIRKRKYGY